MFTKEELKSIRLIAFDFDGVFTDNKVITNQDGSESVSCWRSDGIGISRILELGIIVIIISTESNPVAIISSDIEVFPTSIKKIQVKYYKTPAGLDPITGIRVASTPRFGYSTVNGVEQFIPSQSVDFELPNHYIPKIIMEIGKMVGVSINEADLFQYGTAEEVKQ